MGCVSLRLSLGKFFISLYESKLSSFVSFFLFLFKIFIILLITRYGKDKIFISRFNFKSKLNTKNNIAKARIE